MPFTWVSGIFHCGSCRLIVPWRHGIPFDGAFVTPSKPIHAMFKPVSGRLQNVDGTRQGAIENRLGGDNPDFAALQLQAHRFR